MAAIMSGGDELTESGMLAKWEAISVYRLLCLCTPTEQIGHTGYWVCLHGALMSNDDITSTIVEYFGKLCCHVCIIHVS